MFKRGVLKGLVPATTAPRGVSRTSTMIRRGVTTKAGVADDSDAADSFKGDSGRDYSITNIVKFNTYRPASSLLQAEAEGKTFVVKKLANTFETAAEMMNDFSATGRLCLPIDEKKVDKLVVFKLFPNNFTTFLKKNPPPSGKSVRLVLRGVAEAIKEMHEKDWVHMDIKPENILIMHTGGSDDDDDEPVIQDVVLADFELAMKLVNGAPGFRAQFPPGSVFWRSPEAQLGQGLGKPTDIFSLGRVFLWALGGRGDIVPDDSLWLDNWPGLDAETKEFVSAMVKLDPAKRATIEEVLDHAWWDKA